ncbi:UNVERIFIED_CONTAM: hypothetical protein Sindi_0959300, partial [Sesamum indicum]
ILRGAAKFKWDKSSQEAFDALKRYLSSPPLLTKPRTGPSTFTWQFLEKRFSRRFWYDGKTESTTPVYYVSRMLQGVESSPEVSRRMAKWAVELSEFGVEFQPRPAIKAQALADFIVELAYDEAGISTPSWSLHVDGSSTSTGSEAGIVLESPEGDKFEYAIKLEYPSSNNEAEYEAFLAGGKLALAVGARKIVIYSDSQLLVNQIQGSFETRDEKMAKYSLKAKTLFEKFEEAFVIQLSRTENAVADQLAKLASSMAAI